MTETTIPRCSPTAYAIVLPPPDGRAILRHPNLIRYGCGLWPDGFAGTVVGVIIDAGTGITESGIRAALTVTVLDQVFAADVERAAVDHALCELDRIVADAERRAREDEIGGEA